MIVMIVDTGNFEFIGLGNTEAEAAQGVLIRWEKHCSNVPDVDEGYMQELIDKAEVLDWETETALGEDSLYGIVYATGDRTYGGYRSELVSNAIDTARGFINRLKEKVA